MLNLTLTHTDKQAHYPGSGAWQWSKEDTIQVFYWGRRQGSQGILWIFISSLDLFWKKKQPSHFQTLNSHQETSTASENAGGDSSGERETPQAQISGFTWFFEQQGWVSEMQTDGLEESPPNLYFTAAFSTYYSNLNIAPVAMNDGSNQLKKKNTKNNLKGFYELVIFSLALFCVMAGR